MHIKLAKILIILIGLLTSLAAFAQQTEEKTSDELFTEARALPKEQSNYPVIISLLNQALTKSPNYADIRMFLGRVYTWSDKLDSARFQFNQVLAQEPNNEEAHTAIFDLEYWNSNYSRALDHANMGLLYQPQSAELALRKAKALVALEKRSSAIDFLKIFLAENPDNKTLQDYYQSLIDQGLKNSVDVGYEFVYFDKRFNDPWHYASLGYTRDTGIGSIAANLLYSNRFRTNAMAFELEAYPSISKGIYAYAGFGYSNAATFYRYRTGLSLYYSLPKSFDAETGFRYMNFNPTEAYIYVLALGKYIGNYYFNLKSYISPDLNTFSHSFTFSVKYYFSDRYNVLGAQIGSGISPDDQARNLTGIGDLHSYKFGINYGRTISRNLSFSLSGLWYYEEYRTNAWGNQIGLGLSLLKKF